LLGPHVILERRMPVEVVRAYIGYDRYVDSQSARGLELEAGKLGHRPGVVGRLIYKAGQREADISSDKYFGAGRAHQIRGQCSGGCLAIRSRDTYEPPPQKPRRKIYLADDLNSRQPRRFQRADS